MNKTFSEYLSDKGKMDKVKVDPLADTGPDGKKFMPKAQTKGHKWHNVTATEALQIDDTPNGDGAKPTPISPKPYSAPGTDPGQLTADGGKNGKPGKNNPDQLVKKGDQEFVYNPKVQDQRLKASVKTFEEPPMKTTEEFLNKTRSLNAGQYAEYVLKQTNAEGVKQIIETVKAISKNNDLIEALVREIKRNGDFPKLVESILNQPELYNELAIGLAHEIKGKEIARQMAKAINEITAPSASKKEDYDDEDDEEDESKRTTSEKMPPNETAGKGSPTIAKSVSGAEVADNNIRQSRKQYVMMRPEHHLIEALANYRAIRATMKNIVD
jgi:hypothetical protein